MELRPRHFKAMRLLVGTDMKKKEIAAAVGVTPSTLAKWQGDEEFEVEMGRQYWSQPFRLDALRLSVAERLLYAIESSVNMGRSMPHIGQVAQLLDRLVGKEFSRMLPGAQTPAEPPAADPAAAATEAGPEEPQMAPEPAGPAFPPLPYEGEGRGEGDAMAALPEGQAAEAPEASRAAFTA